jgi:hypothetical protein
MRVAAACRSWASPLRYAAHVLCAVIPDADEHPAAGTRRRATKVTTTRILARGFIDIDGA